MYLVLIGGGEHASVIVDTIRSGAAAPDILGFVDPDSQAVIKADTKVRNLGDDSQLKNLPPVAAVIAFASMAAQRARGRAVDRLSNFVVEWVTIVHPSASVSNSAVLGAGTVIMAGAIVQAGAIVGKHCVVNSGAIVEHDVVLHDYVQVASGAVVGGGAQIGEYAYIGLGASVRDHVVIGHDSIVGMGGAVVVNIEPESIVMGVPAR